jgi:hypothetical protein
VTPKDVAGVEVEEHAGGGRILELHSQLVAATEVERGLLGARRRRPAGRLSVTARPGTGGEHAQRAHAPRVADIARAEGEPAGAAGEEGAGHGERPRTPAPAAAVPAEGWSALARSALPSSLKRATHRLPR